MKVMSLNMDLEHYALRNITQQLPQTSDFLHESLAHTCGGTGGWRRVVYLDMTDPNTNCPSGGTSLDTPREHVVELVLVDSPVTPSSSLSVEEPTLVCVELLEPTSTGLQMDFRLMTMEK